MSTETVDDAGGFGGSPSGSLSGRHTPLQDAGMAYRGRPFRDTSGGGHGSKYGEVRRQSEGVKYRSGGTMSPEGGRELPAVRSVIVGRVTAVEVDMPMRGGDQEREDGRRHEGVTDSKLSRIERNPTVIDRILVDTSW